MPLPINEHGQNLFHAAAVNGVPKSLSKLILAHKRYLPSALLARDKDGYTPAHLAAKAGNLRALKILIAAAPDCLFVRDSHQQNVLDLLRHDDTPYTYQLRTRLVAWGPTSIADESGLCSVEQPELPGNGVDRFAPRSIVKLAISPTQAIAVCQRDFDRHVFATRGLKLMTSVPGRCVAAATAQHSVLLTDKSAYTWGSNAHGQLAQDIKSCAEPMKVDDFLEYKSSTLGGFEALAATNERIPVEPLVDTECTTHYSVAWTTTKLYAWGLNSGQILGEPKGKCGVTLVYDFKCSIQSVACLDNAIAILANGRVHLAIDGELRKTNLSGVEVRGRGRFLAVSTEKGRLHFCHISKLQEFTKIPVPKSEPVVSFDVAETGLVVIATTFAVYTWQQGKDLVELPGSSRYNIRKVCCDARGSSFLASQEYFVPSETLVSGASLAQDLATLCPVETNCNPRVPQPFSLFEDAGDFTACETSFDWTNLPKVRHVNYDSTIEAEGKKIPVHGAILLGRCPCLNTPNLVSTRGGCTVKRQKGANNNYVFANVSYTALVAFAHFLYTSAPTESPPNSLGKQYRDLQSLVGGTLSVGILRAKSIDPDVCVKLADGEIMAHSFMLRARSDFFRMRLSNNWASSKIDLSHYSSAAFKHFLDFLYSGHTAHSLKTMRGSEAHVFDLLVELSYLADELMHSQLSEILESGLVECVNFDTCIDILEILPNTKTLNGIALEFYARHMDYYIRDLAILPNWLMEKIEVSYKKSFAQPINMDDPAALIVELTPTPGSTPVSTTPLHTPTASNAPSTRVSPAPESNPKREVRPQQPAKAVARPAVTKHSTKTTNVSSAAASPARTSPSPTASISPTTPWAPKRSPAVPIATPSSSDLPQLGTPRGLQNRPSSLPKLGQTPPPLLPRLGSPSGSMRPRAPSTVKISRLSQKERRKLQQEHSDGSSPSLNDLPAPAPWSRPMSSSNSLSEHMANLNKDRLRKAQIGGKI